MTDKTPGTKFRGQVCRFTFCFKKIKDYRCLNDDNHDNLILG